MAEELGFGVYGFVAVKLLAWQREWTSSFVQNKVTVQSLTLMWLCALFILESMYIHLDL
jgi:hypothetical protein